MACIRASIAAVVASVALILSAENAAAAKDEKTSSGARIWVDPKTPGEKFTYTSSRGDAWELVMSDEFDTPGREFGPGMDHMWTAIESPDGVNAALEYYAIKLATTECLGGDTVCYLKLQALNELFTTQVWNEFATPPGMQSVTFNYQSAMVQSWNKFCFQGGMIEVRAKLPGAVSAGSKNPDLANGATARVQAAAFYPTWPGVWMMGNLGRALFSQSTNRMWPYSYSACEPDVFDPKNQRISACDDKPPSGMNAKQGRGAPEIDIIEGGGLEISSSLQIAPGMKTDFRRVEGESPYCFYGAKCETLGANSVGVPTATYAARGHKNWYQGLRYASNPFCTKNESQAQTLDSIQTSLKDGITGNKCDLENCPASLDVNSDLGLIDGAGKAHWGINADGACFAQMNVYQGTLLCSPGNTDPECAKLFGGQPTPAQASGKDVFKYQMDALSANWPIHLAMYTDFLAYQVEWVPGSNGYIRWMLEGTPIFEIPAEALTSPPQDTTKSNPSKMLPEEPMYLIMNLALSSAWTAEPPNAGRACRDHGNITDPDVVGLSELICDQFPLDLKIDYVRVYQDLSASSKMSVGCDPASHPTKQWIQDHKDEYQNDANPMVDVIGLAPCVTPGDCSLAGESGGSCSGGRCQCNELWSGPRCTIKGRNGNPTAANNATSAPSVNGADASEKNSLSLVFGVALGGLVALVLAIYAAKRIRMCMYYKSEPEADHHVHGHITTAAASNLVAYPRPSSERQSSYHRDKSPALDFSLQTIPETPPPEGGRQDILPRLSAPYRPIVARSNY